MLICLNVYVRIQLTRHVLGQDASAATFVSDCATDTSCGPVTVIQGLSTAIFTEADQPYVSHFLGIFSKTQPLGSFLESSADQNETRITTVWECEFTP